MSQQCTQRSPAASWAALGRALPAGWGRRSFLFTQHWGGHIWSAGSLVEERYGINEGNQMQSHKFVHEWLLLVIYWAMLSYTCLLQRLFKIRQDITGWSPQVTGRQLPPAPFWTINFFIAKIILLPVAHRAYPFTLISSHTNSPSGLISDVR